MSQTRRYPGSRPFQDSPLESLLFRGRDREKEDLLQLILAYDQVLLYARSGIGKTSLLNAGVMEALRRRSYLPVAVRLNLLHPMDGITESILNAAQNLGVQVERADEKSTSLVLLLSKARFWRDDTLLTPVIVFDQFEELFTLHEAQEQRAVIGALSDLAFRNLPPEYEVRFGQISTVPYKIVFSIREDYLGDVEAVAAVIPTIMHHRFRLTALSREQARKAITEPAQMVDSNLHAPSFRWTEAAVDELILFLSRRRERDGYRQIDEVEPFQLQIICHHVDDEIAANTSGAAGDVAIEKGHLGGTDGMNGILEHYYNNQIDHLPEKFRETVHELCESGLISPAGKRLSLEEDDIFDRFSVDREILKQLVDLRLLRADARVGSTYYELSHDSLVSAVEQTGRARRPQILLGRARIEQRDGNFAQAIGYYLELLKCAPEEAAGYVELSSMLIENNQLEDAKTILERARDRNIEHKELSFNLATVLLKNGDKSEAISHLKKSLELDPQFVPSHCLLGDAYRASDFFVEAENSYRTAIDLTPDNGHAHSLLLNLLLDRRQLHRMVDHVQTIRDRDCLLDLLVSLATGLRLSGSREASSAVVQQALEYPEHSFDSLATIAQAAFDGAEDMKLAVAACQAASVFRTDAQLYRIWGSALQKLDQDQEAVEVFSGALAKTPNDVEFLVNRAWSLFSIHRNHESIEDCKAALRLGGNPAKPLECWGCNLSIQGQNEEAIEKFRDALKSNPDDSLLLVRWSQSLISLERFEEATEKARLAIKADPSNAQTYLQLALSQWNCERLVEADEMFRVAADRDPRSSEIFRQWGCMLSQMERHDEAIDKLRHAHDLKPKDASTIIQWGICLHERGWYAAAVEKLDSALDLDPSSPEAHSNLARSLIELQEIDKSMSHFAEASSMAPNEAWIYHRWASALIRIRRYSEAEAKFQMAAQRETDGRKIGDIYAAWGNSLHRLNRHAEAEEKYREALKTDEDNVLWLGSLAVEIADQGRPEKALELLIEAERLGPTKVVELGELGWAFYQADQYDKSLSYSRRAVALNPNALYLHCNIGLALLQLHRPEEARAAYETAVRIAERTAAADEFAYHAIDDVENALRKLPDLPGGRAVLEWLHQNLNRLRALRERSR